MRGSTKFSVIFSNELRGLSANPNLTNFALKLWHVQNEALLIEKVLQISTAWIN